MREADYPSSETLAGRLAEFHQNMDHTLRNLTRSFAAPGSAVAVPANASNRLVEAVKAAGCRPRFAPLMRHGGIAVPAAVSAIWLQTIAGQVPPLPDTTLSILIDATETAIETAAETATAGGERDGATPPPGCAAITGQACLEPALRTANRAVFATVATGLQAAAGVPVWATPSTQAEPLAVVVDLPDDVDAVTFLAYARGENVAVGWWAQHQPLHPLARQQLSPAELQASQHALSRLLFVPIGPHYTEEEQAHAVLVIVKAAEYTGWRWVTDPARAQWYSQWLNDQYGPDHDAYRPAFPL